MTKNRRGGYRQPAKPAPVATPDRNRTDGGPGSKKQPLRRLPDADYGANKAFVQQQQGASLPVAQQVQVAPPNIFAPTERPQEQITEGVPVGPGSNGTRVTDNIDMMLQAMYEINPSPVLLELINNRNR